MAKNQIVVVGTVAFDRISEVQDLPNRDETARIQQYNESHGGAGANVAKALGHIGEHPILLSTVGEDFADSTYEKDLRSTEVNLEQLKVVDKPTSRVFIFTDNKERQQIYSHPGAVERMDQLEVSKEIADQCEIAHFAAGHLPSYPPLMAEFDHVTFDPGQEIFQHDIEKVWDCFPCIDILILNEHEFSYIEERGVEPVESLVEPDGPLEALIVSQGDSGCQIRTAETRHDVSAVEADVVDPSGAGDAHRAGLIFGLNNGLDLIESVKLGSTIAAFAVEQSGAQESLPSLVEIRNRFEATWDYWPFENISEEAFSVPITRNIER